MDPAARTEAKVEFARMVDGADSSWTDAAKTKASQIRGRATAEASRLQSTLDAFIRREPTKALIGAAGIGALLGILIKRAR